MESSEDVSTELTEPEDSILINQLSGCSSIILPGWPGYRSGSGLSGYDPLELDFEAAFMEGLIIRKIMTGKLRTRNVFYLAYLFFFAVIACLPLVFITAEMFHGDRETGFPPILCLLFAAIGLAIFFNIFRSFQYPENRDQQDLLVL